MWGAGGAHSCIERRSHNRGWNRWGTLRTGVRRTCTGCTLVQAVGTGAARVTTSEEGGRVCGGANAIVMGACARPVAGERDLASGGAQSMHGLKHTAQLAQWTEPHCSKVQVDMQWSSWTPVARLTAQKFSPLLSVSGQPEHDGRKHVQWLRGRGGLTVWGAESRCSGPWAAAGCGNGKGRALAPPRAGVRRGEGEDGGGRHRRRSVRDRQVGRRDRKESESAEGPRQHGPPVGISFLSARQATVENQGVHRSG